jgi:16S rRNA (guanine527-N7)-methyltransferase
MPLSPAELARRLAAGGIEVGYLQLLEQWNRVHNLTGIRDRDELIDRHLVESLSLAPYVRGPSVADIGSGAGLPGLPLAIDLPTFNFTLIESRRKRVSFLRQVGASLGIENLAVAHGRVESLALPRFATVLARAVAPPRSLLEWVAPLLAPGGRLVMLTGADKGAEILERALDYRAVPVESSPQRLKSRIIVLERKLSRS